MYFSTDSVASDITIPPTIDPIKPPMTVPIPGQKNDPIAAPATQPSDVPTSVAATDESTAAVC